MRDLFDPPPTTDRRCGTCVVFNTHDGERGQCAIAGARAGSDVPVRVDCWFPLDELRLGLYGRKVA